MKIFATGDIHSYFSIFKQALDDAGYDYENEDHLLVLCGDCFDRGPESQEMYDFLMNHTERTIIIAGNHRDLMYEMLDRGYFKSHDMHNGTVRTVCDLGGITDYQLYNGYIAGVSGEDFEHACQITRAKLEPLYMRSINYFETQNYIFTHSWIPLKKYVSDEELLRIGSLAYLKPQAEYNKEWRNASEEEWYDARWDNPFKLANAGLNKTNKTIVFGHWHTSWYYAIKQGLTEFGPDACFDIAYDSKHHVIGVDACTAMSNKCNILVLEDELLK